MKLLPIALALMLVSSIGFSLWNYTLPITVYDLNGIPVEGAAVSVTYQRVSSLSEDDGLLSGSTGTDGIFTAQLENKVPELQQSYKVRAAVTTGYWAGEARIYDLNSTGPMNFTFTVPVELEAVYIEVLSSGHVPVPGAEVALFANALLKKGTDETGNAVFYLPAGTDFTGSAANGNLSADFTSADVDAAGGKKTLTVVLPETAQPQQSGNQQAETGFELFIVLANGSAAQNHQFNYAFGGSTGTATTNSSGSAHFPLNRSGQLLVTVTENEYDYGFNISFKGQNSETVVLSPLLQINSFYSEPDGADCYRVIAEVHDPRTSLPLDVRMERYGTAANFSLPVTGEQGGIFTSRLCIKQETKVTVRASNKYEAAGAVIVLLPSAGGFGPIAPSTPSIPVKPAAGSKLLAPETLFLPALLVGLVAALVLAFVFARRYVYMMPRFITQYLYKLLRDMRQKRGPKMPPMGEPPAE